MTPYPSCHAEVCSEGSIGGRRVSQTHEAERASTGSCIRKLVPASEELPLEKVADVYCAMDERGAIKALLLL